MRWLDCITDSMDMSLSKFLGVGARQGSLVYCGSSGCKESDGRDWMSELNKCMKNSKCRSVSHSLVSNSLEPHRL